MTQSLVRIVPASLLLAVLALATGAASAQSIKVKCEVRANRSTASVDGFGLADGNYSAVITSGANTAASPQDVAILGEAAFDFASNAKDIHKGATPIAANFIVGASVTGSLLDASGAVVATRTAACRVR